MKPSEYAALMLAIYSSHALGKKFNVVMGVIFAIAYAFALYVEK